MQDEKSLAHGEFLVLAQVYKVKEDDLILKQIIPFELYCPIVRTILNRLPTKHSR